jgi:hypothetical protein
MPSLHDSIKWRWWLTQRRRTPAGRTGRQRGRVRVSLGPPGESSGPVGPSMSLVPRGRPCLPVHAPQFRLPGRCGTCPPPRTASLPPSRMRSPASGGPGFAGRGGLPARGARGDRSRFCRRQSRDRRRPSASLCNARNMHLALIHTVRRIGSRRRGGRAATGRRGRCFGGLVGPRASADSPAGRAPGRARTWRRVSRSCRRRSHVDTMHAAEGATEWRCDRCFTPGDRGAGRRPSARVRSRRV